MRAFIERLKRIRRSHDLPVDQKLPESIDESTDGHARRVCADCGNADSRATFTVEDMVGNERAICSMCWRKAAA